MKIEEILSRVPDYHSFCTVSELADWGKRLAETYPERIERFSAGLSRQKKPLWCLKIGSGSKNALCFACPHPNEPIGAMTLMTLAELFAQDDALLRETGMTWYLIPCIDPDGTALNEGWFKGPFNIENYARGFFRPSGVNQVEWTFPFEYNGHAFERPLPETLALMHMIATLKPSFVYSLHNLSFGGAYWYVTRGDAALCAALEGAAHRQGIPLHLGEPEAAYIAKFSKAVHSMMSMRKQYEFIERTTGKPCTEPLICGTCSADYIDTVCDCLTLIAEVPYFMERRIGDGSPSDLSRAEVLAQKDARRKEHYARIEAAWGRVRNLFRSENPFPLLIDDILGVIHTDRARVAYTGPDYERPATVAEKVDSLYLSQVFELLDLGMAIRACTFELDGNPALTPEQREALEQVRAETDARLIAQCRALEDCTTYEVIPIRSLVCVQLESALQAVTYCQTR